MKLVVEFQLKNCNRVALARRGSQYYTDGKQASLLEALRWFAKMERNTEGSHSNDYREVPLFLNRCADAMEKGPVKPRASRADR